MINFVFSHHCITIIEYYINKLLHDVTLAWEIRDYFPVANELSIYLLLIDTRPGKLNETPTQCQNRRNISYLHIYENIDPQQLTMFHQ